MAEQQIRGKHVVRHLTPGGHASAVALVEGNVVIRVALPGDQSSATWAARAKAGRALRHASLAKLVGAKPADPSTGEPAFVASEYIDGATLAETGPALSEQESDRMARSLAAAVKALHEAGLPHGRIHPANIRVRDLTPVLLDIAATWGSEPTKEQDVTALVETVRELDLSHGDRAIWDSLTDATSIDTVMLALTGGGPTPISAPASEDTSVSFVLATPAPEPEDDDPEPVTVEPAPFTVQEPGPWENLPADIQIPDEPALPTEEGEPRFVTFDPTPTPEPAITDSDTIDPAVAAPVTEEPEYNFALTPPVSEPFTPATEEVTEPIAHDIPTVEQAPEPTPAPVEYEFAPLEAEPALVQADTPPTAAPATTPVIATPASSERDEALVRAASTARAARDEALTQVDQLTQRLTDIVGDLATAHSELDDTTVRLEQLTIERNDLARDLASEQEQVHALTARLNDAGDAGTHLAAAEEAATKADQRLRTALADLTAAQEALDAANARVDASDALIAAANARAERAERDASAANARAATEEAARVAMTRERASAALAAASNTDGLRDLNGQIARLRADLQRSNAALESARAEAVKNAADAARVRDVDTQIRTVEAESAALRRLTADLSARVSQPAGDSGGAERLRAELSAASAEVARLRAENAATLQRFESAEAAARTAQAQVAAAQDHARRVQEHAATQIEAAGAHAARQVEAARASVAQSSAAPAIPSVKEEAYQQEITSLTESLETVSGQRDSLAQRVSDLEGEASVGGASGAVTDLYAKLSLAENELERAKAQIADLTSQLQDAAVTNAHLVEVRTAQPAPHVSAEPIPLPVNPGPAAFMQARPAAPVVGPPLAGPPLAGPPVGPVLPPAPAIAQGGGAPTPAPGGDGGGPALLRLLRKAEASGSPTQLL